MKLLLAFALIVIATTSEASPRGRGGRDKMARPCKLPIDPGMCLAYKPSWGYNWHTKECERFVYGGCGGNGNRFATEDLCERICEDYYDDDDDDDEWWD